ncbi:MAG TPA: glycosyltransferase [Chloroflexota bacterium]|nr:glycosyltransferase [Chloroflexota bacterium]
MNITILALGSQGDVQPYVSLGQGLLRAGHQVRVATHAAFEPMVRSRGLGFALVRTNPRDLLGTRAGHRWLHGRANALSFARGFARVAGPAMREIMSDCFAACADADLIAVSLPGVLIGLHLAEKTGAQLVRAFCCPAATHVTVEGAVRATAGFGGQFSLASDLVLRQALWLFMRKATNEAREAVLGLPPVSLKNPFRRMDLDRVPLLYAFSSAVFFPDPHWGDWVHVAGYWFLDSGPDWRPPAELERFIEAGDPPVYVGFGSMNTPDPRQTTALIVDALSQANVRGVLQTGWGGLHGADLPSRFLAIEGVPHEWLFPRMAAVVHHGGAGTLGYALRAGVPSVIVPFTLDQPFWGRRVQSLGVGPAPVPRRDLTVDRLASAVHQAVTDPGMRSRAKALGRQICEEDGVASAIDWLEHRLSGSERREPALAGVRV